MSASAIPGASGSTKADKFGSFYYFFSHTESVRKGLFKKLYLFMEEATDAVDYLSDWLKGSKNASVIHLW